jgi:uncharacterized protein (UPF0332 family)
MKEGTRLLLEKAERAIQATDALLTTVGAEFAAGRAYYAMFYTAEALLHERDLKFSKHGSLHAAYGKSSRRPVFSTPSSTAGSSMPSMSASKRTMTRRLW